MTSTFPTVDSTEPSVANLEEQLSEGAEDEGEGIAGTIPYSFAKKHNVLVNFVDEKSIYEVLCFSQPSLPVISELKRRLRAKLVVSLLSKEDFEQQLRETYDKSGGQDQFMDDLGEDFDLERLADEIPEVTDLLEASDDAPIIKFINTMLTQAIRENASDIHLEAFEKTSVVRFRVDGVLRDVLKPQRSLHGALVSRLKVMSKLDIAEKRLPQDGRISLRVADHPVDVRVSTLPTQHGERVVLRLLDKQAARLNLEVLGMRDKTLNDFVNIVNKPNGIVLVTGPTGSGKTTTLYSALQELNAKQLNILTVEDPVEYDLDGVGQTQINPKIGLSFASGLRSILRQDPDVVLVGEIRDVETANISVQASLTGHMVLSTLHTNTAVGAVTRLIDMGVESFLIASSLLGVLAQRLVRQLCEHCKAPVKPTKLQRQHLTDLPKNIKLNIHQSVGCNHCDHTGYQGRIGIYEFIVLDETLRRMIHDQVSEGELVNYVRQSTPSISQDGFIRVANGETTFDEVLRVTQT